MRSVGSGSSGRALGALLAVTILVATPVSAQQVTGTSGSPSATTSISGNQLPPPDPPFGAPQIGSLLRRSSYRCYVVGVVSRRSDTGYVPSRSA